MKLNIFIMIFLLLLSGCAKKEIIKDKVEPEVKKENVVKQEKKKKKTIKQEPKKESETKTDKISLGWNDQNTYTVKVIAENSEKGKEKAKHKILQDIVKVRMMNESRFTDITKINTEFEKPLKNGKIISETKNTAGIEIFFQIYDEGLKQKFEKK